jgi:phenylalanyl-tRNA synthetase alpha chain
MVSTITDKTQEILQKIAQTGQADDEVAKDLKKRKLVLSQKFSSYKVTKGPKFTTVIVDEATDVTSEMLAKYLALTQWRMETSCVQKV